LIDLNTSGQLKTSFGNGWTVQDNGVTSFALDNRLGDDVLIDLNGSGELKTSSGNGWMVRDTGVISYLLLDGGDTVFARQANGTFRSLTV
jgi:hypothetical protein